MVTYLYDIVMENELPDYLQYDFGLTKLVRSNSEKIILEKEL